PLGKHAHPVVPARGRLELDPEALLEQAWHRPEELLLRAVLLDGALHRQVADREPVAVSRPDLLDRPAHEPGLARLPGRPDREEVPALVHVAGERDHALPAQRPPRHREMLCGVDRAVGVEPPHGVTLPRRPRSRGACGRSARSPAGPMPATRSPGLTRHRSSISRPPPQGDTLGTGGCSCRTSPAASPSSSPWAAPPAWTRRTA